MQTHRAKQLRELGFRVELIDSKEGVKEFMERRKLQTDGGGVGDEP